MTYGQKLIAEAIEAHFGERVEDYDEDADDTANHDVWEAFDALATPPKVGSEELDAAEVLGRVSRVLSYPVSTEILSRGWDIRHDIDSVTYAVELCIDALASPVDHPEVVGDEHHEFEAVMLEALIAIQAGCVLPPQEQELLDRALAGAKAGAGVRESPWQEKFRATLQKDSGASVFRDEQGTVQVRFSDEVAWLIERKRDADWPHPRWYAENDKGFHWWTALATEAKQFATEAEAGTFPAYQMIAGDPTISITEHVFLGSDSPALEAGVAEALREAKALLADLRLGQSIQNDRFPDRRVEGPLWDKIGGVVQRCEAARAAREASR